MDEDVEGELKEVDEEKEERDSKYVDPEYGQRYPICHMPIIKVDWIEERCKGCGHEAHDVEVCHCEV